MQFWNGFTWKPHLGGEPSRSYAILEGTFGEVRFMPPGQLCDSSPVSYHIPSVISYQTHLNHMYVLRSPRIPPCNTICSSISLVFPPNNTNLLANPTKPQTYPLYVVPKSTPTIILCELGSTAAPAPAPAAVLFGNPLCCGSPGDDDCEPDPSAPPPICDV